MLKRIMVGMLAIIIAISFVGVSIPTTEVFAYDSFEVEVIKSKAPIREGCYESKAVKKWVTKGTILTIVGEKRNLYLNLWYKVKGGGYIYSENVKKSHNHKVVFNKYGSEHPHYAEYKCKSCNNGAYCSSETTKVKGCSKCYPSNTSSKKENTNKVPNSNVTTKADILVPKYDSLQEEAEKKLGTTVHDHNYKFSQYSSTHPHYAIYKCSCGDSYEDTKKTEKQSSCTTCYPPHEHKHKHVGYNKQHPHYAMYECSCGNGYSSSETTTLKDCSQCYPYGYGNDHFCQFVCTERFLNEHPHYTIAKCSICGKEEIDTTDTNYNSKCQICNSTFKDNVQNVPDFYGRVYDLSTGGIIYTPKKVSLNDLYSFAEERHISLDMLGLVPVFGEVFDGINVLYYIVEGNYVDAALSGAAIIPFVGVVSTTGKISKNSGKLVIDVASDTIEASSQKITKELIEKGLDNVNYVGKRIIKNSDEYSKSTLKAIKKITENSDLYIDEAFYRNDILITKEYKGTITTPSGLKYPFGLKDKKNRTLHIIDKHSYSKLLLDPVEDVTYFYVDGKDIIELIDELYLNGRIIEANDVYNTSRTTYLIRSEYPIGTNYKNNIDLYNMIIVTEDDVVIISYRTRKEER